VSVQEEQIFGTGHGHGPWASYSSSKLLASPTHVLILCNASESRKQSAVTLLESFPYYGSMLNIE
jgi:hypothetical protein